MEPVLLRNWQDSDLAGYAATNCDPEMRFNPPEIIGKTIPRSLWATLLILACTLAAGRVFGSNSFGSVYISELLVEDSHPGKSTEKESSGWIELYNAASFPVNLSGWFLTDD